MAAPAIPAGASQAAATLGTKTATKTLIGPQPDPTRSLQLVAKSIQQTQGHPALNGKLVSVAIPAGATSIVVNHGLGYKPSACLVAMTPQPLLLTMPGGESDPTKTLNVNVNAGGFTASLWVF
jgi:hypothetical protein